MTRRESARYAHPLQIAWRTSFASREDPDAALVQRSAKKCGRTNVFVVRRWYRSEMLVSGQEGRAKEAQDRGPRARMRKMMLDAAMRLMQDGLIPSVSDVAEAAQVSRATAYRYFPSQSALIQAAVDEALGPILAWKSESTNAEDRVAELVTFAYPRMESYEATLKAALRLALDQWARRHAGLFGDEAPMVRGHRINLLNSAILPLKKTLSRDGFERLTQSLSLVFGTEAFVVLKDIWGLDPRRAQDVALWTCHALIQAAVAEDGKVAARPPASAAKRRNGVRGAGALAKRKSPGKLR
jgi:AcrR family transcriptional regulator